MDEIRPKTPYPAPVVVVGGTLNSLGVVRSLAAAQVPIHVVGTSRACAAGWSRHARFVPTPSLEGDALTQSLIDLATRLKSRAVLVLTADESVETISEHRGRIEPLYHVSLPAHEIVVMLSDKILFQQFAQREGFPVPHAVALSSEDELPLLANLTPPLILKPANKLFVLKGLAERAVRADSIDAARAAAALLLKSARRILVQEWIDGADDDLFFTLFSCDRSGKLLGIFTGRKLICSPPAIGSTAVCIAAPEASAQLMEQTRRFIGRTQYRGLGSLEFKFERSSGRYLIVEPTVGRTDWQEEIATICGMNLPLLTYRATVNEGFPETPPAPPVANRAWRSSMAYRRVLRSTGISSVDGFFRWSDPIPAIYYYGYERGALRLWRLCRRLLMSPQRFLKNDTSAQQSGRRDTQ